jgi:hypothetical protein
MDSRMREKDKIDDILVANRASDEDDLKKGIRVNVTSPLALSAQFIRLAEAGKLEAMSPLVLIQKGNFMGVCRNGVQPSYPKLVRGSRAIRAELRRRARRGRQAGRF